MCILIKRIIDFIGALCAIIILIPVLICIAIAIRINSNDSIFFRQIRVGRFGKHFKIIKFRTMFENNSTTKLTIQYDPRITKIGHFLRKYKLDELPQLINILKGDMSFVGPRPEVPEYVELYPEHLKKLIFSVRGGLTDYASIEFIDESQLLSNVVDPKTFYIEKILPRKLGFHVKYVEEFSLFTDFKIILLTINATWLNVILEKARLRNLKFRNLLNSKMKEFIFWSFAYDFGVFEIEFSLFSLLEESAILFDMISPELII